MAKVDAIDSAKSAKAAKKIEKEEEKVLKAEEQKKAEEAKKSEKTDSVSITNTGMADYKIEMYVAEYINRLIAKFDGYDDIISRLRSYLGNFDIDEFRKDYPDLQNNSDLSAAMYNETLKYDLG